MIPYQLSERGAGPRGTLEGTHRRNGFKIGIGWQGNPNGQDNHKHIPLEEFIPLTRFSQVRLISRQYRDGVDQLARLPPDVKIETLGNDFNNGPDAFIDTAAVMANLDLISSSCTSIPHLAGALGRPTWVVLKHVPDWRWLLDREDSPWYRRTFIGGSDARIIMGDDEATLIRLWKEKRGEVEPQDYSANLIVQLGRATEVLNRHWYERTTGQLITDVQRRMRHPVLRWMGATLDGRIQVTGAVFEAKFMLPWSFSEEAAAEKHMAQVQHNMWVTNARAAVLSIITGGGKWVEIKLTADSLYQHLLLTAEKKFWRCVESGEPPRLFLVEPPRARIAAVRIVDMNSSNAWAEFSHVFRRTRDAYLEHERAKAELKALMPEDAKEAIGHGLRAKRSRSGAVSFDVLDMEAGRAAIQ